MSHRRPGSCGHGLSVKGQQVEVIIHTIITDEGIVTKRRIGRYHRVSQGGATIAGKTMMKNVVPKNCEIIPADRGCKMSNQMQATKGLQVIPQTSEAITNHRPAKRQILSSPLITFQNFVINRSFFSSSIVIADSTISLVMPMLDIPNSMLAAGEMESDNLGDNGNLGDTDSLGDLHIVPFVLALSDRGTQSNLEVAQLETKEVVR